MMNVIPAPLSVQSGEGSFVLKRQFVVHCGDAIAEGVGRYLVKQVESRYSLSALIDSAKTQIPSIALHIQEGLEILKEIQNRDEGYVLEVVSESGISITAETRAGLFNGVQTFFQLLPVSSKTVQGDVNIKCIKVHL